MKRTVTLILFVIIAASLVFVASKNILAQDTLDVAQGFETLNLAVEGDTTETGEPKNLNRVYRLERGGYYLLNGSVKGVKGAPLRIVAAKGDGPKPILIPAVDETGEAKRAFEPAGDGTWKGLYVSGIDNLGNQAKKNMFRCEKEGGRYIIDDCFLDHDAQSFVRMNAEEQKLYVTNTIMRNSILLSNPSNGRFIDTRGNTQDTVFVQNCTMVMASSSIFRDGRGIVKNLIWDHVTVHEAGSNFAMTKTINGKVTNSLFIDVRFEGTILSPGDPADTILATVIWMDTSYIADDPAFQEERDIIVKNNNQAYTPEIQAWFDEPDSIYGGVFLNQETQYYFDTYPKMIAENNISEFPEFSDPPDPSLVLTYAKYRRATNNSNENNPDPRIDRNGMAPLVEDPASVGPCEDECDFDYPTTKQSYTHAEGGFPLGDLNWFPDKKAEWQEWIKTSVEFDNPSRVPDRFELAQNFPNPFNPSTTIAYQLNNSSDVKLIIYNTLGQKIRTLIEDKPQSGGEYSIKWDGRDDAGNLVATGIYVYRLEAGNQIQAKKMLLMK